MAVSSDVFKKLLLVSPDNAEFYLLFASSVGDALIGVVTNLRNWYSSWDPEPFTSRWCFASAGDTRCSCRCRCSCCWLPRKL